jgi:hypothetical protein
VTHTAGYVFTAKNFDQVYALRSDKVAKVVTAYGSSECEITSCYTEVCVIWSTVSGLRYGIR